jgi:hypothetical protein
LLAQRVIALPFELIVWLSCVTTSMFTDFSEIVERNPHYRESQRQDISKSDQSLTYVRRITNTDIDGAAVSHALRSYWLFCPIWRGK